MAAASLIGFGLVLLGVSMLTSLMFAGALALGEPRLRAMGPWAERRAATLALLLPPLFGLGVSATLIVNKLLAAAAGADHCLDHSHHPHLCLIHGTHWASVPWAVVAIGFFATYMLIRIGQTAWAQVGAQLAATRLKRSGTRAADFDRTFLVPNDDRFAFTTGVFFPTVIVSRAAWEALGASERSALLAHEHAHIAHGDLWKRAALGLLACFGVPFFSQRALKLWALASERVCDRQAASLVGKPSIVASAILSLARSQAKRHAPAVTVFAAACHVSDRVHSLFNQRASGRSAARRLVVALFVASVCVAISCVLFAESLHHVLETILG